MCIAVQLASAAIAKRLSSVTTSVNLIRNAINLMSHIVDKLQPGTFMISFSDLFMSGISCAGDSMAAQSTDSDDEAGAGSP